MRSSDSFLLRLRGGTRHRWLPPGSEALAPLAFISLPLFASDRVLRAQRWGGVPFTLNFARAHARGGDNE